MFLVVGLGNPGDKYHNTRHNIGFAVVDELARQQGVHFVESKWKALTCKTAFGSDVAVIVKPQTFMNLSGEAVQPIAAFYKIPPEHIVVIHDDLDLDCGRIKLCVNRGAGGHNGIKSLIKQFGGDKSFNRVKIGIGRPPAGMPVERFVLSRFRGEEGEMVEKAIAQSLEATQLIIRRGMPAAMQVIHTNS